MSAKENSKTMSGKRQLLKVNSLNAITLCQRQTCLSTDIVITHPSSLVNHKRDIIKSLASFRCGSASVGGTVNMRFRGWLLFVTVTSLTLNRKRNET